MGTVGNKDSAHLGRGTAGSVSFRKKRLCPLRRRQDVVEKKCDCRKSAKHEAEIYRILGDHPNVGKMLSFNYMKSVLNLRHEGISLNKLRRSIAKLPAEQREKVLKTIVAEVHKGISHMHSKGICHRDVSYDNLMLSTDGIRIVDFDKAKKNSSATERSIDFLQLRETLSTLSVPDPHSNGQEEFIQNMRDKHLVINFMKKIDAGEDISGEVYSIKELNDVIQGA